MLSGLEPVELIQREPLDSEANGGREAGTEGGLPEYVQSLFGGVDRSVPLETPRVSTDLLLRYASIFSHFDGDLGRCKAPH